METLNPISSPNKRLKTQTLLESPIIQPSDKGKAPMVSDDKDLDDGPPPPLPSQNCGICFSEEGKSVRGLIDSCNHYYCFPCIVEWSKIESRCPLCRLRFSAILRMRKDRTFIGVGPVKVPVRDQLHDPFGEPPDPYGHARCSVCNGTNDETLLLLCDLCDSASHTFCVGLGATVPEGDWYCQDCTLLRDEQLDSGVVYSVECSPDANQINETEKGHVDEELPPTSAVSIFDIVREPKQPKEPDSGIGRLLKLVSSPTKFSLSTIVSNHESDAPTPSLPGARRNFISPSNNRESSARTLCNCRDVHKQIRIMRENWDALRTGSFCFSSNLLHSRDNGSCKIDAAVTSMKGSFAIGKASTSTKSHQSKTKDTVSGTAQSEQSYNVERAWKLMNAAKSLRLAKKGKDASKTTPKKNVDLKVNNTESKCLMSGKKDLRPPSLGMHNPVSSLSERVAQSSEKHKSSDISSLAAQSSISKYQNICVPTLSATAIVATVPANIQHNKVSSTSCSGIRKVESSDFFSDSASSTCSHGQRVGTPVGACTSLQSREVSQLLKQGVNMMDKGLTSKDGVQSSLQSGHDRPGLMLHPNQGKGLLNISAVHHGSICPKALGKIAASSGASSLKPKGKEVSKHPRKPGVKITSKASRDVEAKAEILSLVKLNLKLLNKDKRLGSDTFKEIARICTHTILATCGFEHRDIARSIPALVCQHGDQPRRCSIVPSSCRRCFYTFVKDVVNSIFSEKIINDVPAAC